MNDDAIVKLWAVLGTALVLVLLVGFGFATVQDYFAYSYGYASTDQFARPYCYGPACETCK